MQSIERMIQIIECFSEDKPELSIKEIVEQTKLHKSTIFRILTTLEKYNYIQKNEESHKYSLGFNFFRIGSIVLNHFDIRKLALPYMKQLSKETNEAISLNVIDNFERVCIEKVDSPITVINFVRIGHSNPLYRGASGKCLLAFWSKSKQEQYFDKLHLEQKELEKLKEEIQHIRKQMYSISIEERSQGNFAISAPILDFNKKIISALTITGPLQRFNKEKYLKLLKSATLKISSSLGYQESERE